MRFTSRLALCASIPFLAPAAAQTTNLGLAVAGVPHGVAHGDLVAFAASEAAQSADLDGDGALDDSVLHVHRVSTGATTNTAIPMPPTGLLDAVLGDRLCLTIIHEAGIGPAGADRNGDGDALDLVYAVHDAQTGTTRNLGLAAFDLSPLKQFASVEGDVALFGVAEWAQGADLDADGDTNDFVLHRYDAGAPAAVNLGLALDVGPIALGPRHALFLVDEASSGLDLNGDGDVIDRVAHALALAGGVVTNLRLAAIDVRGDGDLFAISVHEPAQGASDLDGDGNANDLVLHAYLAPSGTVRNLGRAVNVSSSGVRYAVRGFVIAWASPEASATPGHDWNGDGDSGDVVLFTHHARSGVTRNSGLAVEAPGGTGLDFAISAGRVGVCVPEIQQNNTDLNGDGDVAERVAMVFDVGSGAVTNLGLAVTVSPTLFESSRGLFAFFCNEPSQGFTDLNGDGHLGLVVAVHEFASGATRVLSAVPANLVDLHVSGSSVAWTADENAFGPGTDLNGDGDVLDEVLTTWSATTGVETNSGLALLPGASIFRFETSAAAAVFAVDEAAQGSTDLNADADAIDGVVHVLRF